MKTVLALIAFLVLALFAVTMADTEDAYARPSCMEESAGEVLNCNTCRRGGGDWDFLVNMCYGE